MINYDFPNSTEDYVHRIGRTARAENTGTAYTFFTAGNGKNAQELIDVLIDAKQDVPDRLRSIATSSRGRGGGARRGRYRSSNDRGSYGGGHDHRSGQKRSYNSDHSGGPPSKQAYGARQPPPPPSNPPPKAYGSGQDSYGSYNGHSAQNGYGQSQSQPQSGGFSQQYGGQQQQQQYGQQSGGQSYGY